MRVVRGSFPRTPGGGRSRAWPGGRHQHQHTGMLAARLDNHQVGGQGLALFGNRHGEAGEIALGAGDSGLGHQQDVAQHPVHPRLVDSRIALAGRPLAVGQTQLAAHLRAHAIESLREGPVEYRQREERAGDL